MSFGANLLAQAKTAAGQIEKAKLTVRYVAETNNTVPTNVLDATIQCLEAGCSAALPGTGVHQMTVQYNPSSLSIEANADPIPFTYLQNNADSNVPNQNVRPPRVVLSVELIFDDVNPQEAFMIDRTRLSVGSVVSDIAAIAKKGKYTVQPQTNGLLATVLREKTREVTFTWANLSFTGQVFEAQAKYTMFSPSGRPVRSVIQMRIAQDIDTTQPVTQWDNLINAVFKPEDTTKFDNALSKVPMVGG